MGRRGGEEGWGYMGVLVEWRGGGMVVLVEWLGGDGRLKVMGTVGGDGGLVRCMRSGWRLGLLGRGMWEGLGGGPVWKEIVFG